MRTPSFLRDLLIALVALAVVIALPTLFHSPPLRDFIIHACAYGLLAMSLNLLIGYTGMVSFGHAMFFGIGAYVFALLLQTGGWSIPAAFLAALAATAVAALAIGAICIRLTEIYFAFLTLAFQMMIYNVILAWRQVTGGDQGLLGGIPRPPFLGIDLAHPSTFYVVTCVLTVACILLMRMIVVSPFGYSMRMVRDNAHRAGFLGVSVMRVKLVIFVLAALIASVGGMILALFVSGAYPTYAFWTTSGNAIFMIMLGGMNVFLGPLLGTVILSKLNDVVTTYTHYYGLTLGVILLVIVLGLRKGCLDVLVEWRQRKRQAVLAARLAARERQQT
ncbi:MAG: branched-chain amino acid ABC transporter permease [Rhodospirillales bacterium]|jgi:branched-chain amino acid transport system permease protein|nr:branched-chain amino acid ABC transporter permease [Rhodospirillales bacterium]